jgi:hypothetical protein
VKEINKNVSYNITINDFHFDGYQDLLNINIICLG